jgi:hypothetical protein
MHISQAEEFSLLRDLFIEDPDSLLCAQPPGAAKSWEKEDLVKALNDCNLTPQADPNTPSHTIRVMKAVALVQLVQLNPQMWDLHAVVRRVATMVGMGSIDELFTQEQPQAPADPKMLQAMAQAQGKAAELAQKEQDSQRKAQLEILDGQLKIMLENMKLQNNREQRASAERIEGANLAQQRMELAQGALVHPLATPVAQNFAQLWPGMPAANNRVI